MTSETISGVVPVARQPGLVSVRVGRATVAVIDADAAEAMGLRPGDEWTAERREAVEFAARLVQAKRRATRMLGARARSEAELSSRLVAAGFEMPVVVRAIARLRELGLVNDRRLAAELTDAATRRGPVGRRLLEHRLLARGIPRAVVEDHLRSLSASTRDLDAAIEWVRRQPSVRELPGRTSPPVAGRLYAALLRRGFDEETAREAVERVLGSEEAAD